MDEIHTRPCEIDAAWIMTDDNKADSEVETVPASMPALFGVRRKTTLWLIGMSVGTALLVVALVGIVTFYGRRALNCRFPAAGS